MKKDIEKRKLITEQIYELSTLAAGQFSPQEVLDKLAEAAVKITEVKACSIRLLDEEAGDLKMRSTYGLSEEYRNKGVVSKDDPVIKAAFAGKAVVVNDMRNDNRVKYKEATVKEGLVSQLTVAMKFRNRPIGVLRLYSPEPKYFSREDINIARAVASQCAVAITNAKLYASALEGRQINEQLKLAGTIQRRMIPQQPPLIPGLDIAAAYVPCFDIGGDFYDFIPVNDHSVAIAIADVIGKGIPAALLMSLFKGALRAYIDTEKNRKNVKDIVKNLNKTACTQCTDGEFITLFYGIIDVEEMKLCYCNCGHEPTILIRAGQTCDLQAGGLVLGIDPNAQYDIETINLLDGDSLVFYTDGLVDAVNFQGQLWGRDSLIREIPHLVEGSAKQMLKNILRFRRRFVGLADQLDDSSLIVVKADRTAEPAFMIPSNL